MCVERVEQGTQNAALRGSYVQGDGVGGGGAAVAIEAAVEGVELFGQQWICSRLGGGVISRGTDGLQTRDATIPFFQVRSDPIQKILSIGRFRSDPILTQFFFFLSM